MTKADYIRFREGRAAARKGLPLEANPYTDKGYGWDWPEDLDRVMKTLDVGNPREKGGPPTTPGVWRRDLCSGPTEFLHSQSRMPDLRHVMDLIAIKFHD